MSVPDKHEVSKHEFSLAPSLGGKGGKGGSIHNAGRQPSSSQPSNN
jgi:hypothetical protein